MPAARVTWRKLRLEKLSSSSSSSAASSSAWRVRCLRSTRVELLSLVSGVRVFTVVL